MEIRTFIRGICIFSTFSLFAGGCENDEKVHPILFNPSITYGNLTDQDNINYKTVTIGSQVWMAQNLSTTKLNDNTSIPMIVDTAVWNNLITPAFCWYEDENASNRKIYGALYNWYAVNTGKLCPDGWHVPSNNDWITLRTCLGGEDIAGGKLKEKGTGHWLSPNNGATNESGFTALPSGMRGIVATGNSGEFEGRGTDCCWWSTSALGEEPSSLIFGLWINHNYSRIFRREFYVNDGVSVRCVKD